MKWNRQTIKTVVIVFLVIIVTSFFIKWTFDHDGETITIGSDSVSVAGPALDAGDSSEFYWTEDHVSFERILRRNG